MALMLDMGQAPAHPRVCGENFHVACVKQRDGGSSPRVRGKREDREAHDLRGRLIPACAGKTSRARTLEYLTWAHPRVCGENSTALLPGGSGMGSSPRVRGKQSDCGSRHSFGGLIPACAGKTPQGLRETYADAAHPRVCGENSENPCHMGTRTGSSPRVRGKHRPGLPDRLPRGLIPACAGKTRSRLAWSGGWRAHPRVCGENFVQSSHQRPLSGSSPRVRGKRGNPATTLVTGRLIPACAGKTTAFP